MTITTGSDSDGPTDLRRRTIALVGILLVATMAYWVVVGLRHEVILDPLQWNSDALWTPLVGQALAGGHAGSIHAFSDSYMASAVVDAGISKVGGWDATQWVEPMLLVLVLGLLVWRSWQFGGWVAAATTGALGCAAAPLALGYLIPQSFHGGAIVVAVIVGVSVPALVDMRRRRALLLVVVAAVIGLEVASDPLTLVVAVFPLAMLPAVLWFDRRTADIGLLIRRFTVLGALMLASIAGCTLLGRAMGFDLLPTEGGGGVASLRDMLGHIGLLGQSAAQVVAGIGSATNHPWGLFDDLGAVVATGLLVVAVYAVIARWWWPRAQPRNVIAGTTLALRAYVLFWGLALLACAVAFVVTTYAVDASSARYVTVVVPCLAALVGLAPVRNIAKVTLAMLCIAMNVGGVLSAPSPVSMSGQHDPDLARVLMVLDGQGLHHGYADYWDALPLTVNSHEQIAVRPVMSGFACSDMSHLGVCRYTLGTADTWYAPVAGPSFLMVHSNGSCLHTLPTVDLPIQTLAMGNDTIYVFADDLGTHFSSPRYAFCPPQLDMVGPART